MSRRISKYFWEHEVGKSATAARLGIDNTPPPIVLERASYHAINVLDPIRGWVGRPFSPSSWYRCEELERVICAKDYRTWCSRNQLLEDEESWSIYFSRKSHPKGEATDQEISGISNDDLYAWIRNNIPAFDQLIREYRTNNDPMSGWVHVSFSVDGNRNQVFEIK